MKKSFINSTKKFKYLTLAMLMTIFSILVIVNSLNPLEAAADQTQTITDQNGDGVINLIDARILTPPQTVNCSVCVDVNGDKVINQKDLDLVQSWATPEALSINSNRPSYKARYDMNIDKKIDSTDVEILNKYLNQQVTSPAFGLDNPSELTFGFMANDIIVRFKKDTSEEQKQAIFTKYGLDPKTALEKINAVESTTPENNIENLQKQILTESSVQSVNKNHVIELLSNDPWWNDQWGHRKIKIEQAWWDWAATGHSANKIKVAIIDTGVDYSHEDLQTNLSQSRRYKH